MTDESRGSFKTFCPDTPICGPDRLKQEIESLIRAAIALPKKDPNRDRIMEKAMRLVTLLARRNRWDSDDDDRHWMEQTPYYSGDRPIPSRHGGPVFRRASEGGFPLKRATQRREREMLRKARKVREQRERREKDIERARERLAQEEKRKEGPR